MMTILSENKTNCYVSKGQLNRVGNSGNLKRRQNHLPLGWKVLHRG